MANDGKTTAELIEELATARQQAAETRHALCKERVLRRLYQAILSMAQTSDLEAVLVAVRDGLCELEIPFEGCGVNQVDASSDPPCVRVHSLSHGKSWCEVESDAPAAALIVEIWNGRELAHRGDLEAEDVYGETSGISGRGPIRAAIDIPFSHGTLAVTSQQPDAFLPEHIEALQEMAQALSEGFQRREELRALETERDQLEAQNRLLVAIQEVARASLTSLDVDETLDLVAQQILAASILRSLTMSLVDHDNHQVEVVRNLLAFTPSGLEGGRQFAAHPQIAGPAVRVEEVQGVGEQRIIGLTYDLDDENVTARVARTGEMAVIDGYSKSDFDPRVPRRMKVTQVSYFIPVKRDDQVLLVLATGSRLQDKDEMLRRIAAMQPLFDQVAVALGHARLHEESQHEIAERKRAEEELRLQVQRYELVAAGASEGIWDWDVQNRRVYYSRGWKELRGLSPDEVSDSEAEWRDRIHPEDASRVMAALRAHMAGETEFYQEEYRTHCGDGSWKWVQDRGLGLRDEAGNVIRVAGSESDVTRRRREEDVQAAQLRLVEYATDHSVVELLRRFLDEAEALTDSDIGFYHFVEDDETTLSLQTWSTHTLEAMCTTEGAGSHYPIAEAGVWVDCVRQRHPVVHNDYARLPHRKGMPKGHAPVTRELVVPVIRAGKIRAILGVGNKVAAYSEEDVGSVQRLADLAWEIVVRRQAEDALQESERRYRGLFEQSPEAIVILSQEGTVLDCNHGLALTDMRREEIIGKHFSDVGIIEGAEPERYTALFAQAASGQTDPFEVSVTTAAGETLWRRVRPSTLVEGGDTRLRLMVEDVTERRRGEEDRNVQLLLEHLRSGFLEIGAGDDWMSAAGRLYSGLSALVDFSHCSVNLADTGNNQFTAVAVDGEGTRGRKSLDYVPQAVLEAIRRQTPVYRATRAAMCEYGDVLDPKRVGSVVDVPFLGGTLALSSERQAAFSERDIDILARCAQVLSQGHERLQILAQREQAEEALRESEARYRSLVETPPDLAIMLMEPDGRCRYVSPQIEALTGHAPGEFYENRELEASMAHPDDLAECQRALRLAVEGTAVRSMEFRWQHRDGSYRWAHETISPVFGTDGRVGAVQAIFQDITERKEAERSLLQSSRLISLGQMAAGMAHELNQPLTVISALAEGMELRREAGVELSAEQMVRWGNDVMQAVVRMRRLIEHLRTFSRDRSEEPGELLTLNDVARGALSMTRAQLRARGIEIAHDLAEGLPRVVGDQYRLEQVLINLLHNARDAVEDRWQEMAASQRESWQMRVDIRTRQEEDEAVMEVADNGVGMDEEAQLRALEPFYTTKEPDRGTGLGLSISHAIVKDHGGHLECRSHPGHGTVFHIGLPLARQPSP